MAGAAPDRLTIDESGDRLAIQELGVSVSTACLSETGSGELPRVSIGPHSAFVSRLDLLELVPILRLVEPTDELQTVLQAFEEDEQCDFSWDERDPIDQGVTINGDRWGWYSGSQGWRLLPIDFFRRSTQLAAAHAWMSASMAGGVFQGVVLYTPEVSWTRSSNDNDGQTWAVATYRRDPAVVALEAFEGIWDPGNAYCPVCDDQGWVVRISANEELAPSAVAYGWQQFWQPCDLHRFNGEFANDGTRLRWAIDRWVSVEE